MGKIELFAVGGSAGALEALQKMAPRLPRDFPAPICLVLHVSPDSPGLIPDILARAGPLPAAHAEDGQEVQAGRIYVAPPDHHLLIDANRRLRLGRGPKENRFRPAIDPLFRSAAVAMKERACGVILSGGLDDGVAGLAAIKRHGGAAIVQTPEDACVPNLPNVALHNVRGIDRNVPASHIADAMVKLAEEDRFAVKEAVMTDDLENENRFAMGADSDVSDIAAMGDPSLLTCPDCHGALVRLRQRIPPRFRCHTGHAYTLESLAAAQQERVEDSLWSAVRALEEQAALLEHFAEHLHGENSGQRRADALKEAEEAQWRSRLVRDAVRSNR